MNAIDTNIWIYGLDGRDTWKQSRAIQLIESVSPLALPWQVGCEFLAASRKLAPQGFTREQAWVALRRMHATADVILLPTTETWGKAQQVQIERGLSIWDALLVAACALGGVTTLYSEDFGGVANVAGIRIVNPFADNIHL